MASLVLLKRGLFPLIIRDAEREDYIDGLEKADDGDLAPLVKLFSKRQRDAILKAIGLEQEIQREKAPEEILVSAVGALKDRLAEKTREIEALESVAEELRQKAEDRLG